MGEPSIINDLKHFIDKCFIDKNSIIVTTVSIIIGGIIKRIIVEYLPTLVVIFVIIIIGLINIIFIYRFEKKIFLNDLNIIKSYH